MSMLRWWRSRRSVLWVGSLLWLLACALLLVLSGTTARAQAPVSETNRAPALERNLKVGWYLSEPFVIRGTDGPQGMAVDLWRGIEARLGQGSDWHEYPNFHALLEAVERGDVDAAVSNITITRQRAEVVSFTQPWFDGGMRILVHRHGSVDLAGIWAGLRKAGHVQALGWALLVITVLTLLLTLFDRRTDPEFPRRWSVGLADNLFHVISLAIRGSSQHRVLLSGRLGRLLASLWLVVGVIVVAYVTSSITSVMTTRSLQNNIRSVADLAGRTTGVLEGATAQDYLRDQGIATRAYPSVSAAAQALVAGQVDAVVADAPNLDYHVHQHPEDGLVVIGNRFRREKYGFAFGHDSPLLRPATLGILQLHENGTIERLRQTWFGAGS